jgi:hypothetical protein
MRQGTRRDAILHAAGANAAHGLRRTNADKRRAVETLLRDEEWSKWSDREIARLCAVSHPFVSQIRQSLTGNITSEKTYTTKHGTTTTMDTSNVGKKQAPEPEPEEVLGVNQQPQRPDLPPGWYWQNSSNPADIIAINGNNHEQISGFCETHEQAAAAAWEIHQRSRQPAKARIIDMPEEQRESMMAELEALGYDVKYHKGCITNNRKGAPGHMQENLYYVEELEKRLKVSRDNFEREQQQQAERERMRQEIAKRRKEYQNLPEQQPVAHPTIRQCMIDAYRLIKAGDKEGAHLQAQRFRAHPDIAGIIGHAIWGMQCAMEGDT